MKVAAVLVAPGSLSDGVIVELEDAELHHLRVRRSDVGAELAVFDGAGRSAHGTLVAHDAGLAVAIGAVQVAPPVPETILAVGAGDKDRFLLLAERCTELGVTRLIPLETERSRTVDNRVRGTTLDRARRRAREACKQSGNAWATVVDEACALASLAEQRPGPRWLVGHVSGGICPLVTPDESIGWVIGPEGGLTPAELRYCLHDLGAKPVSFGPAVLRFDTAAIAAGVTTQDRRRTISKE